MAFDSTVISLFYIKKILQEDLDNVHILKGGNQNNNEAILRKFELGSNEKKLIGLCSDSVSEGVNMQQASALFHLDLPSVLRIAEQRVGRIERLDSPHKEVNIYWPDDSEQFALRSDFKLINTLNIANELIGVNLDLPTDLTRIQTKDYINNFEQKTEVEFTWEGISDAYGSVKDLIYGKIPIITEKQYDYLKGINADVKCKLSIGISYNPWIFFSIKGSKFRPSKWFFVDHKEKVHTEIPKICELLKTSLLNVNHWEDTWNSKVQLEFEKYIKTVKYYNYNLLSPKRRRTLETTKKILNRQLKKEKKRLQHQKDLKLITLLKDLLNTLDSNEISEGIDYYRYSDVWYKMLKPMLFEKKKQNKSFTKVVSLQSLVKDTSIEFCASALQNVLDSIPYERDLWTQVSACIVALPER
ncbi:MAG: helicase C-terminal domain-containing protein [Saprospiraceae bacterium]